jgi:hypothetical protein
MTTTASHPRDAVQRTRDENDVEHVDSNVGIRNRRVTGDNHPNVPTTTTTTNRQVEEDETVRRTPPRKRLMDLLFAPLTLILGETQPEDPQVGGVKCMLVLTLSLLTLLGLGSCSVVYSVNAASLWCPYASFRDDIVS